MKAKALMMTLVTIALLASPVFAAAFTISALATSKASYVAGETVTITGTLLEDSVAKAGVFVNIEVRSPTGGLVWLDSPMTDAAGAFTSSFKLAAASAMGTYTVYATYQGVAKTTTFDVIQVDTVAPAIISATLDSVAYKPGATVTVTVEATDNIGVTSVTADTTALSRVSGTGASGTWKGTLIAAVAEGLHSITVTASDAAGNKDTKAVAYTTDLTAPTISITSPKTGQIVLKSPIRVTGVAKDNVAVSTVTVNGLTTTVAADGSYTRAVTLKEGDNTITAIAVDAAGNTATQTITVSYSAAAVAKLTVQVEAGALHFPGEVAMLYFQVDGGDGAPTTPDAFTAALIQPDGTSADLTASFEAVSTGLYMAEYTVPSTEGTYLVQVKASYAGLDGSGIKSFLVSPALAAMSTNIAGIKTDLSSVKTDLASVNAKITAIEGTIGTIKTDVGTLKTDLTAIGATVTSIDDRVATIQTDVGTVKADVAVIKPQIASIDGNVASIKTTVGTLSTIASDLASVKTTVTETSGNVSGLSTGTYLAAVLSLVAAIAAIAAVVQITRKVYLK